MLLAVFAALQTQPAPAEMIKMPAAEQPAAAVRAVNDDDLLLFSVQLDQLTLTETLSAYGDPDDPLLPVGELARLLDLDINVSPGEQRITGTVGEAQRPVVVDFRTGVIRLSGKSITLLPADAGYSTTDIYIRASALERLIPVQFEVVGEALAIKLHVKEKLPIQVRLERIARLRGLGQPIDTVTDRPIIVESPYRLFSPPSFDVAVEGGRDTRTLQPFSSRYDVRFAGDLLYSNLQGFVGSDENGRPRSARFLVERRSATGALPLGATRISGGDVYTPALPMGLRSIGGRGISFTTVPLEEASVFDTIDLRGEMPIGFDVELYVNDILRSGERTPVNGRYEFLDVPLVRGLNVIRIVTYGPRGQRSEITRIVNVGGGQLRKHEAQFEFGLVEQGRGLLELGPSSETELTLGGILGPRLVGSAGYGLTDSITLVAAGAFYEALLKDRRGLGSLGLRTSLFGLAISGDAALDSRGGSALGFGAAGQPFGVSTVFQHNEYRGNFIDETINALDLNRTRVRHSALTVDFALPRIAGRRIPLSVRAIRDEFADGGSGWIASARTSATLLNILVSTGLDYQRNSSANGRTDDRLVGNVAASKFWNFKWQLRSTMDFELRPTARVRALSFTADRNVSEHLSLRLGVGQTLADRRDTFGQVGAVFRLPFGELSISGDYSLRDRDWRLAARFGFGSLFNPLARRYVMTQPGAASGGAAAVRAFIDRDGDGRFGGGDEPAERVLVQGGREGAVTDVDGLALVTGLGTAAYATVMVNTKDIDELYVRDTSSRIKFEPRPGQVVEIPYAIAPVGEVYARFVTAQGDAQAVGLSALRVRLTSAGRKPIVGVTEYDGSVVFSDVPLGTYTLELDPEQAAKLRMTLRESLVVKVDSENSVEVKGTVEFGG